MGCPVRQAGGKWGEGHSFLSWASSGGGGGVEGNEGWLRQAG